MDHLLLRTEAVFEKCKLHLDESDSWGGEVESYLTQHLLIVLCADVQQELYKIIERRADVASDEGLRDFAVATGKRVIRSVDKADIANLVANFGSDKRDYFNQQLSDADVSIYGNAVRARHTVAHASGINITFRELYEAIDAAKKILSAVTLAIFLGVEEAPQ